MDKNDQGGRKTGRRTCGIDIVLFLTHYSAKLSTRYKLFYLTIVLVNYVNNNIVDPKVGLGGVVLRTVSIVRMLHCSEQGQMSVSSCWLKLSGPGQVLD